MLRDGLSAPSARHGEGIVHGDVDPSNIMLTGTGNAKPIDIGAAFAREDAPPRSARVRSVAQGSPHSPPARDGNPKGSEMNLRDNDPLHAAIDARLAGLVANCPTPPAWAGPWRRLGPESTDEQRLAVYRAIRSSGSLPEDAGLYLVSWQIDALASRHAEQALDR